MARRFVLKQEPTEQAQFTIDYAAELNPQQYEAVSARDGAVLVVAGAGTGKTRTLIYRVAYLVESGIAPEHILLLTFTRRAAREMLTRASALLDGRCNRVEGGTFHAFCLKILRKYAATLGMGAGFNILDSADDADVINILRTGKGLHKSSVRFPKKKTIQSIFSASTNRCLPLHEVLAEHYPQFIGHLEAMAELQYEYEAYKQSHALLNYDDLLLKTLALMDDHSDIRRQVASGCRYIMVDEYQDTNRLQAELVQHFASVHQNVMAVGDDAQSIYRFRGADFRNIFEFPQRFDHARILRLEQNYRSTQQILDLANHMIEKAKQKYSKTLFSHKEEGELPALVSAQDDRYESRFICQVLLQMREQGIPLNRMAVLFRSSANSFDLEIELNRRNIPFIKYGGMKLSEAAHVKDVLGYLRVLENPRDAVAWNRILQLLPGIGPKTARDLIQWITDQQEDPFILKENVLSPRYIEALKLLFGTLRPLREKPVSLLQEVERIVEYYEPILKEKYFEDYPKRQQDLDHFVALAENFTDRAQFLSGLALDPIELTALDNEGTHDDEAPLILSTIHSAKGLEFHSVFLLHALDGILPSAYAIRDEGGIDEELRLMYVAITRAEENLFISYPVLQYRRHAGDFFTNPSRFLVDIPEQLLEPWSLVDEGAPGVPSDNMLPPPDTGDDPAQLPF